jgi:hypothetical protein
MRKKRRSSREFFERHREHFERSDEIFRRWVERYEARRKAERTAENREAAESSETS